MSAGKPVRVDTRFTLADGLSVAQVGTNTLGDWRNFGRMRSTKLIGNFQAGDRRTGIPSGFSRRDVRL